MKSYVSFTVLFSILVLGIGSFAGNVHAEHILYSVSPRDDILRTINPGTGATSSSIQITLAGEIINGANGLAVDPTSGTLYAILNLSGQAGRELVTINPTSGVAISIGDTGNRFAGIAFDSAGNLFGIVGDGGSNPEVLMSISTFDASTAIVCNNLGEGNDGEAIAYNPIDGLMYHASGLGTQNIDEIFETVNTLTCANPNITLSGTDYSEALALTYWPSQGIFLASTGFTQGASPFLHSISTSGTVSLIGPLDHHSKGLAFHIAPQMVGGEFLPVNTTALLLNGLQDNYSILGLLSIVGAGAFGAVYYSTKRKN